MRVMRQGVQSSILWAWILGVNGGINLLEPTKLQGRLTMVKKITLIMAFITIFLAFNVTASDLKPIKYRCDDGRIFTITFIKAKGEQFSSKANLVFLNSKDIEVLENQMAGSGICYGNEKYDYTEHQGKVSLTDFAKPKKNNTVYETSCHEIK